MEKEWDIITTELQNVFEVIVHPKLVGEKKPPSLGENPPRGVFFSTEGGGFHLNWGGFAGGGGGLGGLFPPVLGGVYHHFWGVCQGGFFLHFQGGFVSLFGGVFSPFCQFMLKTPWLYRECYHTEATPFHPRLSQDLLSVCFMVQFRVAVVVSPLGWAAGLSLQGEGGYGPSLCEPEITVPALFPFEICRYER